MKKLSKIFLMGLLTVGLISGCSGSDDKTDDTGAKDEIVNKEVTIAFLPNEKDAASSDAAQKFLQDEVQKALGDDVEVKVVALDDYNAVAEAILTGTAQIAWESGATFVSAYMKDDKVQPILSYGPEGDPEKSGYTAYIGTNVANQADFEGKTDEEKLEQLKGKSFSFVSPSSTSGCVVPTTTIWKQFGPDGTGELTSKEQINAENGAFFSEVQMAGSHQASVELVANQKVYAGAYCCTYAEPYQDQLYTIAEEFVPNGPMWVNTDYLSQDNIDKLVEHFIAMSPESDKDFFAKDGFFYEAEDDPTTYKFFQTDVDHYKFIIDMYKDQ